MSTTIFHEGGMTRTWGGRIAERCSDRLLGIYQELLDDQRLSWTEHHRLLRRLGSGGQGIVYLSQRRGADSFTLPLALKIFTPEPYEDEASYDAGMARIAQVAAMVAQIQQDNLLDVYNWVDRRRIRLMEMEWIDGFDLQQLLNSRMLDHIAHRASERRWKDINRVIVTAGCAQPRLKPGIAAAIIRDCLAALAALHRSGIVHGDIKPSNIMIKKTGNAKVVDIGSAFSIDNPPPMRTCTPTYAAPEVLEGSECTPLSDLASLGYVFIEMLAGISPFAGLKTLPELLEAKRVLSQRLVNIIPSEVLCEELLVLCRGLISPDPMWRYESAEKADLEGAAPFMTQLVKGDLSSEYYNEIRIWLGELEDYA
ncbi:MAG: serine/threonine-protein kinase [Planctomycetia bacterium]|jgi:serine/threonine-protein kinase